MTPRPHSSRVLTPWLLAGPGALFFAGMILLPLALTVILSFQRLRSCDRASRTLTRWRITSPCDRRVLSTSIFWRTLRIAGAHHADLRRSSARPKPTS